MLVTPLMSTFKTPPAKEANGAGRELSYSSGSGVLQN